MSEQDAIAGELKPEDRAAEAVRAVQREAEASPTPAPDEPTRGIPKILAFLGNPFGLGFTLVLGGLTAWLLGLTLSNLSTVLIYIALALFIALGLDPIVRWLVRHGLKRGTAIVVVIVAAVVLCAGMLALVIPALVEQISTFVAEMPSYVEKFQQSDVYHWAVGQFGDQITEQLENLQKFVTDPNNLLAISGGALQAATGIGSGISGALIVLVLTLYFLASLDNMKRAFYRLLPARNRLNGAKLTEQITASVGGYVMGMVVLAAINGAVVLVLFLILGLPFPPLMAVVAFFITLIPLIGPLLFLAIGTIVALFNGWLPAIIFAVVYLIYIQIEAYVITPRVMNRAVKVPGSLVVIGALVGGTLLGLPGALVAIPVTASILLIIDQVFVPRQDAKK